MITPSTLLEILDLARWAPSGDNEQNWRFELIGSDRITVHGHDTRDHCVYDLDGHPSQISLGALLENIIIAASWHGLRVTYQRRAGLPDTLPTFDLLLSEDKDVKPDPLQPYIKTRSVQRKAMSSTPLTELQKSAMEASVGEKFTIQWLEGRAQKWQAARLMFINAKLRLTMPEAYQVHRSIIDWNRQFSEDKVPDQALGADAMTVKMMHWIMQSWERVNFFNTYLGGTLAPRLQMDLMPSMACGAHFVLKSRKPTTTIDDYVEAGRAVQRFWLCAEQQDLRLQPEVTPIIFSRYVRNQLQFTKTEKLMGLARKIEAQFRALVDIDNHDTVFMGRVGGGPAASSRSTRMPLEKLMIANTEKQTKTPATAAN